jgi:hypothetical protein
MNCYNINENWRILYNTKIYSYPSMIVFHVPCESTSYWQADWDNPMYCNSCLKKAPKGAEKKTRDFITLLKINNLNIHI